MSKAIDNKNKTHDYEILFKDSPEYFAVTGAKMLFEGGLFVRFIIFKDGNYVADEFYPIANIHRIKTYASE